MPTQTLSGTSMTDTSTTHSLTYGSALAALSNEDAGEAASSSHPPEETPAEPEAKPSE